MKYEIKNRFSDEVQFTAEIDCREDAPNAVKIGLAKWALKTGANLGYADLGYANLRSADLIDGGERADGYRFVGWINDGVLQIRAGCRNFTISEARKHWQETRGGTPLGDETQLILDRIEGTAKIRGMIEGKQS